MVSVEQQGGEVRGVERDEDGRWDSFQRSLSVLRKRIQGNGASDLVLADLLEDDLRQARIALHEVAEFLDSTIETVGDPQASAASVITASDTTAALHAVDRLAEVIPGLRRRLGQVALRLTRR